MIISQKKHCFFYSFAYLLLIMAKQALVFESAKELSLKDGMLVIEDKKINSCKCAHSCLEQKANS